MLRRPERLNQIIFSTTAAAAAAAAAAFFRNEAGTPLNFK
jgi:hypothetical protein